MPARLDNVETLLRVDLENARLSLDYAVAMRRFSAFVVDAVVPDDVR